MTQDQYTPTLRGEVGSASLQSLPSDLTSVAHCLAEKFDIRGVRLGGQGAVFFVVDPKDGHPYAAKTFGHSDTDPEAVARFTREAQFWLSLSHHPNLVTAHFVEVVCERPVLFVEFVDTRTSLRDLLMSGPIERRQATQFMHQCCLGMEHASRHGEVAHLDLKPENLLIDRTGTLKVTDFGLASAVSAARGNIPRPDAASWPYAPPERFHREPEDSRSDIFSMGAVFHEMLTSRLPYPIRGGARPTYVELRDFHASRDNLAAVTRQLYYSGLQGVDVRPWGQDGPPYGDLTSSCIQYYPEERYPSFSHLREALERRLGIPATAQATPTQESALILHQRAMSHFAMGDRDRAQELLNQALKEDPENPRLWLDAGRVLVDNGFANNAADCFRQALELDPALDEARRLLTQCEQT